MGSVHRSRNLRFAGVFIIGLALVLTAAYISLTNGTFDIGIRDVVRTLLRIHPEPEHDLVIFEFRLPRIVIALLVGAGLGLAGAVIQSITRNGLADPGILGINSGAGAAMVIFLFFYQGQIRGDVWLSILAMPLFGLAGGLIAAMLIYIFSWKNGRLEPQRLLLTGIAIGSGLSAISLYLTLKMNPGDFEMAAVWNMGSIYNANWKYIISMLPWLLLLGPLIVWKSYMLDLFQLDEDSIISVGIASEKEKALLLLCSIGIVSACVSVSGGVGFVGLMAPHIARRLVGQAHRHMLPVCGIVGALLVMLADYIGRTAFAPSELPVGVVIALLGVPYFIFLLYRAKGRGIA
ncbi:iron chelate uptake ABC transporter family permease subunit [Paenibacillus woosongensis]|uniref:Iron chelate uptake ABC transporter family permease subunit n=1 Tax=Paenibacillus woosongensis TaxID=307580 RepID=A0A7X3CP42_9BACL|nr:iron ABC transporter permease [Paenibacillus woosongensis]MUG45807.1 iron chelate uptake ABC transporter family permease subunit [Paenibacillus woosongensis]